MSNDQKKELAQNLWCALNTSTTNNETVELMDLIEKSAGVVALEKWQEYIDEKKSIRAASLQRIKELLSPTQEGLI
jgi:hypothetical protein